MALMEPPENPVLRQFRMVGAELESSAGVLLPTRIGADPYSRPHTLQGRMVLFLEKRKNLLLGYAHGLVRDPVNKIRTTQKR